jgi:hypothetical protein
MFGEKGPFAFGRQIIETSERKKSFLDGWARGFFLGLWLFFWFGPGHDFQGSAN